MNLPEVDAPVVIVKLRNGSEVVGEMVADDDNHVGLMNPMQIIYKTIPGIPYPIITFKHYMVFCAPNTPVPFKKHDVQAQVSAREAFARFYKFTVQMNDLDEIDGQLDRAVDAQSKLEQPKELTEQDRKMLKELGYKLQLENFDTKDLRKN